MTPGGKPDGRVLDANLARLLRHAYVPVLPRPAFRDQLAREWSAGARELAGRRERRRAAIVYGTDPLSPRAPRGLRPGFVLAAAAALLLVLVGPTLLDLFFPARVAPAALVARGEVAVRALDGGGWSALAEGVDGYALAAPGLELFTPAERTLRVLAADGELTIGASTHATIAADAQGLAVRLDGELTAERRAAPGREWLFEDEHARVRLDEGRLELALRRAAGEALLAQGSGSFELAGGAPQPLAPGLRVTLFPPQALGPLGAAPLAGAGQRQPVEGGAAAGQDEPASDGPPGFVGRVLDADGAPIPAFRVALLEEPVGNDYHEPTLRAFEAADGAFRWSSPERGTSYVFVHADGYAMAALGPHEFDGQSDTPLGSVELVRGGSVRGFVVDARTGAALPDALVLSERDAPSFGMLLAFEEPPEWLATCALTRSDGSFALEHLSVGEHVLRVSVPGHAPRWIPKVAVAEGETVDLGPLALGPGGRLQGTARLPDGTAFAGAHLVVTLMDDTLATQMSFHLLQTDHEGRYAVDDLPPGHLLAVFLGDFREPPKVRPIRIEPNATTTLDFPDQAPATRLFGRLLRADGSPLGLRNLTLVDSAARSPGVEWVATTSDAEGNYVFESVEPGSYSLLEVDNFGRWLALITTLEVPPWPELQLDARHTDFSVEGRAVADADDTPVSSVLVLERIDGPLRTFAGFVRTAEDGSYALRGLPEGRYELTSYATEGALGFEAAEPFVLDATARAQTIVFRHQPGAIVDVDVADASGRPLSAARIEFLDERGRPFSFDQSPLTDDRGRHTAVGVRPGHYWVQAHLSGYDDGRVDIECRAGARHALSIRLSARGQ